MATKPEDTPAAPAEGAGLFSDGIQEKSTVADTATPTATDGAASKPVDEATAGLTQLSVADQTDASKSTIEKSEAKVADAASDPATAPITETKDETAASGPVWPETGPDHPLTKFYDSLEGLVTEAGHTEVYGVELSKSNAFHTKLILQKFLRAQQNDLEKAKQQLLDTLKWRKTFNPTAAAGESFDPRRFQGLGYVLEVEGVPESPNKKDVVTFNIYGAVKDNKATFGDLEAFLRWRVGLMERSVQHLNLSAATEPIPDFGNGPDPYQGYQIHDYLQVSFLRQDPLVKAATKKTIEILGHHYPETLSRKFFVNVPIIMGWVYQAAKLLVAKETAKKFTVLSYGEQLVSELGKNIPKAYGGDKGELSEVAEGVNFTEG